MGRLILLLLFVLAAYLVWKAFGPSSWKSRQVEEQPRSIKGPDDDEEFLWNLEKERFKRRRRQEAEEEKRRQRRTRDADGNNGSKGQNDNQD